MAALGLAAAGRSLPHHLYAPRTAQPDEAMQRRSAQPTPAGGDASVGAGQESGQGSDPGLQQARAPHLGLIWLDLTDHAPTGRRRSVASHEHTAAGTAPMRPISRIAGPCMNPILNAAASGT